MDLINCRTYKKNSDSMACEQWKEGRESLAGGTDYQQQKGIAYQGDKGQLTKIAGVGRKAYQ
jgi:hypothetical protein